MATLVFDIETIPQAWESFDSYTKERILQSNKGLHEKEVRAQLGLSPFTGSIVSVALYDVERRQGAVYYVGEGSGSQEREGDFIVKERTEKEILEDFWEGVQNYDVFVTFNGRVFDVPFLLHRSIVHGVKPSFAFSHSRYVSKQVLPYHVDLMDEFTLYGAMSKRPSLHLLLHAYGIDSRKGEVDGSKVAELFHAGKFRDLVNHNIDDVIATAALYEKWKQFLAPYSFLNAIEY
jgi:predicted PolB exonuclease-like 3'-5' exonuclease